MKRYLAIVSGILFLSIGFLGIFEGLARLALEPHVNFWHVQDMILVQKGAPVLLSPKFNTDVPFVAGEYP